MNLEEYKKIVKERYPIDPKNLPYYIVYDDFLLPHEFGTLKSYMSSEFPWGISNKLNYDDQNPYLVKKIYDVENRAREEWTAGVDEMPFISITSRIGMVAMLRLKANMYFNSRVHDIHYPHIDYQFPHQGALFYLDDCDAPTYMSDGVAIESKPNRLLLFNASTAHSSSAPTNVNYRQTININYFGGGIRSEYLRMLKDPTVVSEHVPFTITSHGEK